MGTKPKSASQCAFMVVLVVLMMGPCYVKCDANEIEECRKELVSLFTCLPYVGGTSKAPTPDCCSGMKQVIVNNKKCVCVLVKDRNDPSIGLKINATLALNIPSICKQDVTIADCPALLHLAPSSPEAKVFEDFERSLHNITKTPASSGSRGSNSQGQAADTGKGSRSLGPKLIAQISFLLLASSLMQFVS